MKQLEIIVASQVNILLQPLRSDEETSESEAVQEATMLAKEHGKPCRILWHGGRKTIVDPPSKKKRS